MAPHEVWKSSLQHAWRWEYFRRVTSFINRKPGWIWRSLVASEVPGVFRNRGQGRLLCGILSWWFLPYGHSPEWVRPHRLDSHFRSREGPGALGHSRHNWRESSGHRREPAGPRDRFQHRRRLQDQGKNLAHARAKFYVLVGRDARWKEGGFPYARTRVGQPSTRAPTPSHHRRCLSNRPTPIPPPQPPPAS